MSTKRCDVFASCVLLDAARLSDGALVELHAKIRRVLKPHRTHHPHLDQVTWHGTSVEDALEYAHALFEITPNLCVALDTGELRMGLLTEDGYTVLLSEATRRVDILSRTSSEPCLLMGDALKESMPSERLNEDTIIDARQLIDPSSIERSDVLSAVPLDSLEPEMLASWVEDVIDLIGDHNDDEALDSLDVLVAHLDHVLQVLQAGVETEPRVSARLLIALARWVRPVWMEPAAKEACELLLKDDVIDDTVLWDQLKLLRGKQLRKQVQLEDSIAVFLNLINDSTCAPSVIGSAFNELGNAYLSAERVEDARAMFEQAQVFAQTHHLLIEQCHAMRGLAMVCLSQEQQLNPTTKAEVLSYLEQALTFANNANDRQTSMLVIGEWANIQSVLAPVVASARLHDVAALGRLFRAPHIESASQSIMIEIALRRGRIEEARGLLDALKHSMQSENRIGRWFAQLYDGFIALYTGAFESAGKIETSLMSDASELSHPMLSAVATVFAFLHSVVAGNFERFKQLCTQPPNYYVERWEMIRVLGNALVTATRAQEFAEDGCFVDTPEFVALQRHLLEDTDSGDEWHALIWHQALLTFPEQLISSRPVPTLVIGEGARWFVNQDGYTIDLAERPYLNNLLRAFVQSHECVEATPLDTFTLFEIGWPGVQIDATASRNRVYVGIANLRKLGLHPWLKSSPDGYFLSPELRLVRQLHTPLSDGL